jgi:hypothetical protein
MPPPKGMGLEGFFSKIVRDTALYKRSVLIRLIQTFSDEPRESKYSNPITRKGGIPQSYCYKTTALSVLDTCFH